MDEDRTIVPYTVTDWDKTPGRLDLDRAHPWDAAVDLRAAEDVQLSPGDTVLVKTGMRVSIPRGYAGLVLGRSGLATKGIIVANSPGLIDSGYHGDVGVILHSLYHPMPVEMTEMRAFYAGERIAQLVIVKLPLVDFAFESPVVFSRRESERGEGGFGSTGR